MELHMLWQCQQKQCFSVLCRQPTHLVLYQHYSHPQHLDIRARSQHVSSNLFSLIFQEKSTSPSKSVLSPLSQCCWQSCTKTYLIYFISLSHFMVNALCFIFCRSASFPVISTNTVPHKWGIFHILFTLVVVTVQGQIAYEPNTQVKNLLFNVFKVKTMQPRPIL